MTPNPIEAAQKLIAAAEIQSVRLIDARAAIDAHAERQRERELVRLFEWMFKKGITPDDLRARDKARGERQDVAGFPPQKGPAVDVRHSADATLQFGTNVRALVRFALDATEARAKRPRRVFWLKASFELVYKVPPTPEPSPEALRAFSQTNAVFNAWPYWREFVQNMTARMNLPPLTLPLFRVAPATSELKKPSQ